MADRPTLYLSNWSSSGTPGHHGPGRKLTIMARPRRWEHGAGAVGCLVPLDFGLVRSGSIDLPEYRHRYERQLDGQAGWLAPGALCFVADSMSTKAPVRDGDTLCCACSREAAAKGECHRVWAAAALVKAGWRVVLDGVEVPHV